MAFNLNRLIKLLIVKDAVRLATAAVLPAYTASGSGVGKTLTGNANGALSVDSVAVALGNRILVKNEGGGTSAHHGLYVVTRPGSGGTTYQLTRTDDADSNSEFKAGLYAWVNEGTVNADSGWAMLDNDPITIDTTSVGFTQVSGLGQVNASDGLDKTGNVISASVSTAAAPQQYGGLVKTRDATGAGAAGADAGYLAVKTDNVDLEVGASNEVKVKSKGAANGIATLDGSTKVPLAQISAVLASSNLTNDAALEKTANKGAASGYASLNGSSKVVQDPASASTTPGSAVIPIADGNGRLADGFTPFAVPRWRKVTIGFAALAAAALTNDIEVYSLAAGEIIHAVKTKHSVAFAGGTISAYSVSIGISGLLNKYSSPFDVFQAAANTTFQLSGTIGSENHGAATSIRIAAVSVGDNLNQANAGSVDVWVLVSGAL